MSETTAIADALQTLQSAQADLREALATINEHNHALDAHPEIQKAIKDLTSGDAIYTREQIREIINELLNIHKNTKFSEAHPGWSKWEQSNAESISKLQLRVEALENRLNGEAGSEQETDLAKLLQAVEDKYAPILNSLQEAFSQAQNQGQTELADQYRATIASTLDEKKEELLAVMTEWQENHGAGENTPTVLIGFDANGGTGSIDAVTVIKGNDYVLPVCTFTAPTGSIFSKWSSAADGSGEIGGTPGMIIQTNAETPDSITLYAIWSGAEG